MQLKLFSFFSLFLVFLSPTDAYPHVFFVLLPPTVDYPCALFTGTLPSPTCPCPNYLLILYQTSLLLRERVSFIQEGGDLFSPLSSRRRVSACHAHCIHVCRSSLHFAAFFREHLDEKSQLSLLFLPVSCLGFFRISPWQYRIFQDKCHSAYWHTRVFCFFVHLAIIIQHHLRHASTEPYDVISESDTEFFLGGAKPV